MTKMDPISTNDSPEMSYQFQGFQELIAVKQWKSHMVCVILYNITMASFLLVGIMVNYKLFDSVRKETHGDSGKVLQWIIKTYALVMAIGIPCLFFGWIIVLEIVVTYGDLLNPCIVINLAHILVLSFIYLRAHVGLNSFILALGRYAYVVHHERILRFGQIRLGKILKISSFVIPLVTTIMASSVVPVQYKGWFSVLKKYDHLCSFTDNDKLKSNSTDEFYRSPIYNLAHSSLSSSVMYGMYVVLVVTTSVLYLNVTEGIIYIKSAIFVIR